MDYRPTETSWILVPIDFVPPKEFWRVMDKSTMKIVCVDKIDPDATLHPAWGKWEPDGVHKGLPFVKGCGCHALNELTKKEREDIELVETAPERRAKKEAKRAEVKAEQEDRDNFEKIPVGERTVIHDTKIKELEQVDAQTASDNIVEALAQEETTEPVIKKRGRPATRLK